MASKRMIAKSIVDSDNFLEMPTTAQLLYFHLLVRGDDEGFIDNPRSIMRNVRCTEDDMRILIAKQYIIPFESGIVVIKHWKIHNYIRKDRLKATEYVNEKAMLSIGSNDVYEVTDACQSTVSQSADKCQHRLVENRLDKNSIDKNSIDILSGKPDQLSTDIYTIIDYLNEVSGKHFKAGTPKTKSLIKARLNEGFTVDDFKTVILKKYKQWKGGDMERYIRPETLFGTKFEGYLNESDVVEIPRTKKYEETPSERAKRIMQEVMDL